jgi:hypothetical protein
VAGDNDHEVHAANNRVGFDDQFLPGARGYYGNVVGQVKRPGKTEATAARSTAR